MLNSLPQISPNWSTRTADSAYCTSSNGSWTSVSLRFESWGPFAEGKNGLFTNPVLASIAEAHHKTTALRSLIQSGVVVIPKTVRADRMAENLDVFDFALNATELERIEGLDTRRSLFGWW